MIHINWHRPGEREELSLVERLRPIVTQLRVDQIQQLIYETCLTVNEREAFEEECPTGGRREVLDIWLAKHRRISHAMCVVELASRVELLSVPQRNVYLAQLGEALPVDWEIEHAVSGGGLVVVEDPPMVFWQSRKIDTDWKRYPRLWAIFWELARKGRRRAPVTEPDIYDGRDGCSDSALPTAITRLGKVLPVDLAIKIERVEHRRPAYLLNLPRHQIAVFSKKPPRK